MDLVSDHLPAERQLPNHTVFRQMSGKICWYVRPIPKLDKSIFNGTADFRLSAARQWVFHQNQDQQSRDSMVRIIITVGVSVTELGLRLWCYDYSCGDPVSHWKPSCAILPIFLYGVETWSVTVILSREIDALDNWCLRRILNVHWSEFVTNDEIRSRTGQPLLSDTVRSRRLFFFGHLHRTDPSQDHYRALQACIWGPPDD